MDNQHRKIVGYRELVPNEIDLMNEIKQLGPQIEAVLRKVDNHINSQKQTADDLEIARLNNAEPGRWLSIAKTDLQKGLMSLTRAVAQPTFF